MMLILENEVCIGARVAISIPDLVSILCWYGISLLSTGSVWRIDTQYVPPSPALSVDSVPIQVWYA